MAERYVQPPVVYFSSIYRQSTASTPIVFVLSPGECATVFKPSHMDVEIECKLGMHCLRAAAS
eukprot:scaffold6126_cov18-Tisochrysis_lutea.AAC.1